MQHAIPIRNLYYLFCYAWQRFAEGKALAVGAVDSPAIVDLLARVLINGLRRLLRRGLDRGYRETTEDTAWLRGRIVVGETVRRNLLLRAEAHCAYDELQHDVLHNRILKTTLRRLYGVDGLDSELARELCHLHRAFDAVSEVHITNDLFQRVQLNRNNAVYDLLLRICGLVQLCLLPAQGGQGSRFADIQENETMMSAVFEQFVRNFYRLEQSRFAVSKTILQWDASGNAADLMFLPRMETDIVLRSPPRTIVIDAKFYRAPLEIRFEQPKIRSPHLYQLLTYLQHVECPAGQRCEGILLYARATSDLDVRLALRGHPVRVVTLDLRREWSKIAAQLLDLIEQNPETSKNY